MSAFIYDGALNKVVIGTLNLSTDTLKMMLVTSAYTASRADTNVGQANSAEIAATGYTGGFGGSSRVSAARSVTNDTTNHVQRVIFSADPTWTSLGGASNATIAAALLIKEITNDAGSLLVAYLPLTSPLTTNGSGFTLTHDSVNGNLTITAS